MSVFQDKFEEILNLMQLEKSDVPKFEFNKKSAPRNAIRQLLGGKYIPTYQGTPEDIRWLVEGEEACDQEEDITVFDLLGKYDYKKKKVVVYDLLIRLCSVQLDIDYEKLLNIVIYHEISHAASHLGSDKEGDIWILFGNATSKDKEYFAQIYTHIVLSTINDNNSIEVMQKLSENQPEIYSFHIQDILKPIDQISQSLLEARNKIPVGLEHYSLAVKDKWSVYFSALFKERNLHYIPPENRGIPGSRWPNWTVDVIPPGGAKKYIKGGSKFTITTDKIQISSYDYSPSSNSLTPQSTILIYDLLVANKNEILDINYAINSDQFPVFKIKFEDSEIFLDIRKKNVLDIWNKIVEIIGEEYPVFRKVLIGYREMNFEKEQISDID